MPTESSLKVRATKEAPALQERASPALSRFLDTNEFSNAVYTACVNVLYMQLFYQVKTFPVEKGIKNAAMELRRLTNDVVSENNALNAILAIANDVGLRHSIVVTTSSDSEVKIGHTDPDRYMQSEQAGMSELFAPPESTNHIPASSYAGNQTPPSGNYDPDDWYKGKI